MTLRGDMGAAHVRRSIRHTMFEAAQFKAALAAFLAVVGTVVGSFDFVFFGTLGLWFLDMVVGTARALDAGEALSAAKARSGFLRGIVYICMVSGAAVAVEGLVQFGAAYNMTWIDPAIMSGAVWGVCGWVAYAEVLSIGRNADHFYPGAAELAQIPARLLARALTRIPRPRVAERTTAEK